MLVKCMSKRLFFVFCFWRLNYNKKDLFFLLISIVLQGRRTAFNHASCRISLTKAVSISSGFENRALSIGLDGGLFPVSSASSV